jgi:uncharacterized membrane protein YdbT with pleckstrin-like domain
LIARKKRIAVQTRKDARGEEYPMSYVKRALTEGETLCQRGRLHWILWLRAWAALVFLGVIVVGIVIFVRDIIYLTNTEVALTDRRLIQKTGFLEKHVSDLLLGSIEAVKIEQGFWGNLLGFGRVEVHGTGDEVWRTPLIADPVGFRREIAAVRNRAATPVAA